MKNIEKLPDDELYVMLMLQRSEANGAGIDCEDTDVVLACLEDLNNCPAACKAEYEDEGETSDEVVKSGSLVVTATSNSSKSIVKSGTSDMDALKFKTSEEVTISKVVLERYGRSYWDSVQYVRLEDEDGNVITTSEENTVNNKDRVSLSIKKDYRTVDGTLNAIVRVKTSNASGSTIGFKVADVTSTAKDVDLGDYTPFEYDIVDYTAGTLTVSANATTKSYNYEAGESYEVAKFKLRAGTSAIKVKGFTLSNKPAGTRLSDEDFLEDVVVTFDGKEVKNLNSSFNSDDALVISFDAEEIGINKTATVVVKAKLSEGFDEYGREIQYKILKTTDVKATESKTNAQASVGGTTAVCATYKFNGSKVKLNGEKLGNIDAAQGAEGVLIAQGNVTLNEAINKGTVKVKATFSNTAVKNHVDHLTLVINGDEYDSQYTGNATTGDYYFSNVEIEESGKVQVKININENDGASGAITFGSLIFTGFQYVNDKDTTVNPIGTITVSKVTLQPAKASMENDLTKEVQFIKEVGATKTVFEGTYTAKKGDIYLKKFAIVDAVSGDTFGTDNAGYTPVRTFYLYVNGEQVSETDDVSTVINASGSNITDSTDCTEFDQVLVKKGETATIKVVAEIDAQAEKYYNYKLFVWGVDESDNDPSGIAYDDLVTIRVVAKGNVTIPTSSSNRNTVLLKAKNQTIATFTVKPSNNNEGLDLENLILAVKNGSTLLDSNAYKVKVAGIDYSDENTVVLSGTDTVAYEYTINEELPTAGLTVEVSLKDEIAGVITANVMNVNFDVPASYTETTPLKTFTAKYASALVYIASQTNERSYTQYKLGVDKFDDDYTISRVVLGKELNGAGTACTGTFSLIGTPTEAGDEFEINNLTGGSEAIGCISYTINGTDLPVGGENALISTADSSDYFKVNGTSWRVYKAE